MDSADHISRSREEIAPSTPHRLPSTPFHLVYNTQGTMYPDDFILREHDNAQGQAFDAIEIVRQRTLKVLDNRAILLDPPCLAEGSYLYQVFKHIWIRLLDPPVLEGLVDVLRREPGLGMMKHDERKHLC